MFTHEEGWAMSEPDKVIAVIKAVGVWRLANWDGCCCSHFSIRNVKIDASCGKGQPRCVKVSSRSLDYEGESEALRRIGEEVAQQIQKADGRSPTMGVAVEEPR